MSGPVAKKRYLVFRLNELIRGVKLRCSAVLILLAGRDNNAIARPREEVTEHCVSSSASPVVGRCVQTFLRYRLILKFTKACFNCGGIVTAMITC